MYFSLGRNYNKNVIIFAFIFNILNGSSFVFICSKIILEIAQKLIYYFAYFCVSLQYQKFRSKFNIRAIIYNFYEV
jgi:small basic protein